MGAAAVALVASQVAGAAPANDSFSAPTVLSGWTGSTTGTNIGATLQSHEPVASGGAGKTVWFRWTPSQSGAAAIDTLGSGFDTVVSVYTGTRVDRLTLVATNDNAQLAPPVFGNTSRVTFTATAGVPYSIQVDGMYGASGSIALAWNRPAPANDRFAAATSIAGSAGTVSGTDLLATSEPGEPVHGGVGAGASVWYAWTAPVTGVVDFDTRQSQASSTVVAVYTGTAVNALTPVGRTCTSYDYACSELQATAGQAYRIAVDVTAPQYQGNVTLHWQQLPSPPNDAFAAAQAIAGGSGSASGTTVGATTETGEPPGQRTVWYRYTPLWTGQYAVAVSATSGTPQLSAWTGSSIAALAPVLLDFDDNGDPVYELTAGAEVRFRVDGGSYPAPFTLTWRKTPPPNDDVATAQDLGGNQTWTQTNAGATKQPGEANHAGNAGGASVWFRFATESSGMLTLDTAGSDFDTLLAVYAGAREVAADDDAAGTVTSSVSFHVDGAVTYLIAVDGRNGAVGSLQLRSSFAADAPDNDAFARATVLGGEHGHAYGRTFGATRETGEPNHAGAAAGNSVWYRWVAPATGRAEIDTYDVAACDDWFCFSDTNFDSVLAVYRGSSLDSLQLVAANDDGGFFRQSRAGFSVTAGETFYVAVDGSTRRLTASRSGDFALNWNVGPPNDDLDSAQTINGTAGEVQGTSLWSTIEDPEGDPAERDGPGSVWYRWRAPTTGWYGFSAETAERTYELSFFQGTTWDALAYVRPTWEQGVTKLYAYAGDVFRVRVAGDLWGPFTLSWQPTTAGDVPPPGDQLALSWPISGDYGLVGATTTGATAEPWEHFGTAPGHPPNDIWFRWTAPADGTWDFNISSTAVDYPYSIAVYEGTTPSTLRIVHVVEDDVRVGVRAGVTYSIAVGFVDEISDGGAFELNWHRVSTAPTNDAFVAAATLSGSSGSVSATSVDASPEAGEPGRGAYAPDASVWYAWTAPASGVVSFQVAKPPSVNGFLTLGTYAGTALGALTAVGDNEGYRSGSYDGRVIFAATAGATYRISVDGSGVPFTLSWRQPAAPPNDNLAAASPLGTDYTVDGGAEVQRADNFGATREAGEPNHAGVVGGASVWFMFRLSANAGAQYVLDTAGSDFDTVLAVYTGDPSSVSTLTPLAGDDDSLGNGLSRVQLTKTTPWYVTETYYVAVDGKNAANGHVRLRLNVAGRPGNDDFVFATLLAGSTGSLTQTYEYASLEPGEPSMCGGSVWFRWTAPATGTEHFDLSGTTVAACIAAYTGDHLDALTTVALTSERAAIDVPVVAGRTYSIAVHTAWAPTLHLAWRPSHAPSNDNLVQAQTLTASSGSLTTSNDEASRELGEPHHADVWGLSSLWFRWTAPAAGTLSLDTMGSVDRLGAGLDTALAVYTGTSMLDLSGVAASDDEAGTLQSGVRVPVTAGTTYLIATDVVTTGGDPWAPLPVGDVHLRWSFAPPPANDSIGASQALAGSAGSAGGTLAGSTVEFAEPFHSEHDGDASVWYGWTAPASGSYGFTLDASGFTPVVGVYTLSPLGQYTVVRRSDDLGGRSASVSFAADAGTTYYVAVAAQGWETGPFTLSWSSGAPANDAFAAADAISGRNGHAVATTRGATKEPGEPDHAGDAGGASVWYRWVAPETELVSFDTVGSSFDTLLGVYTGSAVGALTAVASSDDAPGITSSLVRFPATAGTTYWIAVDGKAGATGDAIVNWSPAPHPENDDFADAWLLAGRGSTDSGSTYTATIEPGEPAHAGAHAHSVWYRWKAPDSGTATIGTARTTFAAVLAVYTGDRVDALTRVAEGAGPLSFAVTRDTIYSIAVDGTAGASGAFDLTWRLPPPNDDFAGAAPLTSASGFGGGTLDGASWEAAEPLDDGWTQPGSVWYRFDAPLGGTYAFQLLGADDSSARVAAFSGTALSDLRLIGEASWYFDTPIVVTVGATPGTPVWLRVVRAGSNFQLAWRPAATAPANDDFAAAQPVYGVSGTVGGTTYGASAEPYETGVLRSIWYRWTAPASGQATFSTTYSGVAVFTGTTLATATELARAPQSSVSPPTITLSVTAGVAYSIQVGGYDQAQTSLSWALNGSISSGPPDTQIDAWPGDVTDQTSATFSFHGTTGDAASFQCALDGAAWAACASPTTYTALARGAHTFAVRAVTATGAVDPTPPTRTWTIAAPGANDAFAAAAQLTGDAGTAQGSTFAATKEPGEPNHGATPGGHSIWYRWVAPRDGVVRLSTQGSGFDTTLGVYTGTAVGALALVVGDNDVDSWNRWSVVSFDATAGSEYRIAVDGAFGAAGAVILSYALSPSNDDFARARPLDASGTATASNVNATAEVLEPLHADVRGGRSIWFTWTAGADGTATVDTFGSDFDTTLAVYTGDSLDTLARVAASNDDGGTRQSRVSFAVLRNGVYRIAVDGYGGATGTVQLHWSGPGGAAPETRIDSGPSGTVGGTTAIFVFSSPAAGATFECRLDFADFGPCTSPQRYDGLAEREHVFAVRAVAGGVGDPTPATRTWTAVAPDGAPPETYIQQAPYGSGPSADFWFAASEPGATFACRLDGGAWAACTSPKSYGGLTAGAHVFEVRATDAAGNADASPASWSWTVTTADTTPPETTIDSGPSGVTSSRDADFAFSGSEPGVWDCRLDGGAWIRCGSPFHYTGIADGPHTFEVRGTDPAGNTDPTPATRTWTIDMTTAPDTSITSAPPASTEATSATFAFGATKSDAVFTCSLDSAAFAACTSPTTYGALAVGSHAFRVRSTDRAGNSDATPASYAWTITAPSGGGGGGGGPDTTITGGPSGTVAGSAASFTFTSTSTSATFECALDAAAFAACASPQSYTGLADGAHTFQVRARDTTGVDATPASRTWTADTTPPDTTIDSGPSGTVSSTSATFAFSASESGTGFQCSLDGSTFADCTSPVSYSGLATGTHTFQVRALDFVRNEDPTPATRTWTIAPPPDTTPPETTIDSGPSGTVASAGAVFAFSATEAGSTFQCQLDAGAWTACTSPVSYSGLADGAHSFGVRATDAAGNADQTPATRSWTVDTTAPDTTISAGPSGATTSTSASFSFSSPDAGATFECRLDGATWSACTSPQAYSALAVATHTFDVRAKDGAGNLDATPATRTWTVSSSSTSNDNFANAAVVSGTTGTTTGSTAGMTKESGEPNHAGNAGGHSIWYRWTAPGGGTVTIDTFGSSFDTVLAAYTGAALTSLAAVASNDDAAGRLQSQISFTAVSGTTYSIAIDGYGGASGAVTLNWKLASAGSTSNDMFSSAAALTGSSGTWTGSNASATKEAGEPNHAGNAGGHSIWFSWTAPAGGATTFKTAGSSFDTLLAVYTGSAVGALTQVAANDDADGALQSRVAFTATTGTTFRIAVDGYSGATGNVTLTWSQP